MYVKGSDPARIGIREGASLTGVLIYSSECTRILHIKGISEIEAGFDFRETWVPGNKVRGFSP
jgi:hypothetical protein